MIKTVFYLKDQKITRFKMTGHADFATEGLDIVCAGVSALAINIVNSLERFTPQVPQVQSDNVNGGYLEVTGVGMDEKSQLLLAAFQNGIIDIAERYDQYIEVKMFEI